MKSGGQVLALLIAAPGVQAELDSGSREVIAAEVRQKETGRESDHLTGDWGGLRTRLVDRGVHFQAGYAAEVFGNVSGGVRRGPVYAGLLELAVEIETDKARLWPGGVFRFSSLNAQGSGLSRKHTGDLLTVSNIEAEESFRLYEAYYEHALFEGRFSIRAGQMLADDEFALTEAGSEFLNSAFGWPAFISLNTLNTGPAYFVAAPGARIRVEPGDRFYAQAGIFDGDTFDNGDGDARVNRSGTYWQLNSRQGVFAIAEAGWRLQPHDRGGMAGEYKVGGWLHSGEFASNYRDENGASFARTGTAPAMHRETYGFYVAGEQMIWREDGDEGLSIFSRAGYAPGDRALMEWVLEGGLTYRGAIAGRDQDTLGIGAVHARVSRDIIRTERIDAQVNGTAYPRGFSDHETVLELFYALRVKEWLTVQPDVQWLFNPGAGRAASDAIAIGLRTTIVF